MIPVPTWPSTWGKPPFEEGWKLHSLRYRHVCSVSFMVEDEDDDRFEAALRLAEDDPARGAEALRSIVADDAFDPDTRSEAAARLAEVGG